MANIVITSMSNGLEVDFGDYWRDSGQPKSSKDVNAEMSFYHKEEIRELWKAGTDVFIRMDNRREWKIGITQLADNFVIDTIDGVAPTDALDLYQKIRNIL
jgi:hypothetical protein